MASRLENLKLSQKALLATMVPFVINVGWLVAMWGNSLEIGHLAERERTQANLVEEVNRVTQVYYEVQGAFVTAFYTGTRTRYDIFVSLLNQFNKLRAALALNPHLLPPQKYDLEELAKFADYQNGFLKESLAQGTEDKWQQFARHRKILLSSLGMHNHDQGGFKDFLERQRLELDELRNKQQGQQSVFLLLLIGGVSANLIIAIFVHYLFGRHVTRQIDTLAVNARALSKKQTLLKPLAGKDDFAIIDAALHKSQRELADAVAYREALMQMVAHDLKSPLSASQVSLALILEREKEILSERAIKSLDAVVSNNKRLLALIADLLTIDAFEAQELELNIKRAALDGCVKEAVDILSGLIAIKSIDVTTRIECDEALFDYQRVLQVLVNFLSNAVKFSKKNSTIEIICENFSPREVIVRVVDHGSGISDSDKPMIFQRYFQTEDGKKAQGTGLGLAISKFLMDMHEEEIGFDKTAGGGTTFWFTLKRAERAD